MTPENFLVILPLHIKYLSTCIYRYLKPTFDILKGKIKNNRKSIVKHNLLLKVNIAITESSKGL